MTGMPESHEVVGMTKRIKLRTLVLGVFLTLLFFGLIFRVYWIQVGPVSAKWAEKARQTWLTSQKIPQERGMILDRDGKVLAADAVAYTVAVNPRLIAELDQLNPAWHIADRIVAALHETLGTPEDKLRAMVAARRDDGTYLEQKEIRPDGWKVDKSVKDSLEQFRETLRTLTKKKNVGLTFIEEQKRYYPNGDLASHVLGYTNKDGVAVYGLEKSLDDQLKGSPGFIQYEKDKTGAQLPNGKVEMRPAIDGKDITLTLDRDIQFFIEDAIREAYERFNPLSITAIAADPKTMDILGMASLPNYDPNHYWLADPSDFKNHGIQSVYEPGSTFKIVTMAAAIEEGLFDPEETYMSGKIRVPGATINDHNGGKGWGEITFLEGLQRSSNVAFVKIGLEKLGAEKLRHYIEKFGFGRKTGIELPGELSGLINFNNRIPSEVATATFGQGRVQVTPIQQVAAVAAVANGGKLMKPRLIQKISDPSTGTQQVFEPTVIREVISERSARQLSEYLETVVSDQTSGSGKNAYIPGYRIAGKTGTAQKVVGGKYSEDKFVVSFIGFAPVDDPQIVLYVIVDEPQTEFAGGGSVAAPIFKKIMGQSLRHLGIYPEQEEGEQTKGAFGVSASASSGDVTVEVPDVTGLELASAKRVLGERKLEAIILGTGNQVKSQLPEAGSVLPASQHIYLMTSDSLSEVPELAGLSLRDALEMCSLLQANCSVQGEGYVVSQQVDSSSGRMKVLLVLAPPVQASEQARQEDLSPENTPDDP
jgi:penicillin-binding protein 2B